MIYLDPKSDIAFKKLFGNITHKNILISFLNSVLERIEGKQIVDVIINDPSNLPENSSLKFSIVDVRCTDQTGKQYIIEMQVMTQKDYAARAQYYSALALGRQLTASERYEKLVPVIFVGILDFNLFKADSYLSHHLILDTETYVHELKHFEFHFVELSKFTKPLEEITTILDKWLYFLKHAVTLQTVPNKLAEPVLKEAFGILAQSNWSVRELEAYDRYLDSIRANASRLDTAFERGLSAGELKASLKIAKQFLDLADDLAIAERTGLTVAEVAALRAQHKAQK